MSQMLLFPDPRPLVERLGQTFFRQAPECPGVYLMRDAAEVVLYLGKAKNLRKRLGSYRVANPERLRRRHLRLLHTVARIELQECSDEAAALNRESELLRSLRPRFNRAGTWPSPRRFLAWRVTERGLDLALTKAGDSNGMAGGADFCLPGRWAYRGPFGSFSVALHRSLVRLLWCALYPERGIPGIPQGWFQGRPHCLIPIPRHRLALADLEEIGDRLRQVFAGGVEEFAGWVRDRASNQNHLFEVAAREVDLKTLLESTVKLSFENTRG